MKVGLIGNGYWGSIIKKKLVAPIELIFEANSRLNYDGYLPQIEWAFVATPPNTHYRIVKKLLENNVNIFCEKPFTGSVQDSAALFELAKEKGLLLYVNNIFVRRNVYLNFKERLKLDGIAISKIEFIWNKYGPFKDTIKNDLFYHDAYLFLDIIDNSQKHLTIQSVNVNQTKDKLSIEVLIDGIEVIFTYDRLYEGQKHKKIKVNDTLVCDFSNPDNDPLNESIQALLFNTSKFPLDKNHFLTLKAENLITALEIK